MYCSSLGDGHVYTELWAGIQSWRFKTGDREGYDQSCGSTGSSILYVTEQVTTLYTGKNPLMIVFKKLKNINFNVA